MKVILHFPTFQSFRLWCKDAHILRDQRSNGTLHLDQRLLGHYRPAETDDGIFAIITIHNQGGVLSDEPNTSTVAL